MFNQQSPFIQKTSSVTQVMLLVMLALIPGILVYVYYFGFGVLFNLSAAIITALVSEFIILKMRGLSVKNYITDGSAIVAASLLAISIPSIAPWWIIVIGTLFTIVIAKHLYGGLGSNLFNPAMVGYAALLISFPAIMTKWPQPIEYLSIHEHLNIFLYGLKEKVDGFTSATPLDFVKTQLFLGNKVIDTSSYQSYADATKIIGIGYLLGGIFLWYKKIITWHLPITFIISLFVIASIFWLIDPIQFQNPMTHILSGGSLLCAFFIITDPVSGPTTPKGKIIFALGVAVLVYLIRVFGGYPEGIAFAVIFMNICVPLIDKYSQPKVFGHD
jgi:electron transport complex protein RnfD